MWIDRLDVAGFGKLTGEKIEFKPNKLNLIVEPNDYGKSTIAEAIWATLFDFPRNQRALADRLTLRDAFAPKRSLNLPYIASIDVSSQGRSLKVIRDFEDGSLQIVDRKDNHRDVTNDFLGANGEDETGLKLTGMTRELFLSTFYIGQRQLAEHMFEADVDLASMFQSIADSSTPASTAGSAINLLDEMLSRFPHGESRGRIDQLIKDLEARLGELEVRVRAMDEQRRGAVSEFDQLMEVDDRIAGDSQQVKAQEYFELALQAAEMDNRLIRAQKRVGKLQGLKNEVERLSDFSNFPYDTAKQVEELWHKRQAKTEDFNKLHQELAPKLNEFESSQDQLKQKWGGLHQLTAEDVQNLGVLAMTLRNTEGEIKELQKQRELEAKKVKEQQQVDLDKVDQMKRALQYLDAKDLDDARTYEALINAATTQTSECEKLIAKSRALIEEVEEEKRSKKSVFFNSAIYRRKELDTAAKEIEGQQALVQELRTKINNLTVRLDNLARKTGVRNGNILLKQIQEFNAQSALVKELDVIDNVIATRRAALTRCKNELAPYYKKAVRQNIEITVDSALAFSSDASRCMEESRTMGSSIEGVKQGEQDLETVQTEIVDIEALLESIFIRADMQEPANLEGAYAEFNEKLAVYQQWERLRQELVRQESELRQELPEEDFNLPRLEEKRNEVWTRMQDLVKKHPEISEMDPALIGASPGIAHDTASDELDTLRQAREQKIVHVRSVLNTFDDAYVPTLIELDNVQRSLARARQAKSALELARDTLSRLSEETYVSWASRLNVVARELLGKLGFDYEKLEFDSALKLTVQRRGDSEKLHAAQIMSQLSTGTKEQLHWLGRMTVCRFLSGENPMPIILDEIFSEADDDRFLRMMQFLLDVVVKDNQIIMFSCHEARYRALMDKLTPDQVNRIELCRKTSLRG
ncbi:MAG TPA: AAA family ATPase [Planktothrix sp.]|jgi:DNA repair exonuclease SbcCD ATPase subunit